MPDQHHPVAHRRRSSASPTSCRCSTRRRTCARRSSRSSRRTTPAPSRCSSPSARRSTAPSELRRRPRGPRRRACACSRTRSARPRPASTSASALRGTRSSCASTRTRCCRSTTRASRSRRARAHRRRQRRRHHGRARRDAVRARGRAGVHDTKVGLGGSAFHVGGARGPGRDGVPRRASGATALERVGLFDEAIKRGQDWELNRRLRETGGTVWFTPELAVTYRPRSSVARLARQMFSTGLWRGELARRFPAANGIRYFIPPVMVLGVALGILLGHRRHRAGRSSGRRRGCCWASSCPRSTLLFVVAATLAVRARAAASAWRCWFLVVLPCIHVCWGVGFVLGYLSLTSNIAKHTGR